jgi:hypothetical protein
VPGYQLRVCTADRGEPGKGNATMRVTLFPPGPVLVYDSLTSGDFADQAPASACDGHELDGGNVPIHSGLKGNPPAHLPQEGGPLRPERPPGFFQAPAEAGPECFGRAPAFAL